MQVGDEFFVELNRNHAGINAAFRRGEMTTTFLGAFFAAKSGGAINLRKEDMRSLVIRGRLFPKISNIDILPRGALASGYRHPTWIEWRCFFEKHPGLANVQAYFLDREGDPDTFMHCSVRFEQSVDEGRIVTKNMLPLMFLVQEEEAVAA